ncbi:hypothetical protein LTR15_008665 [Elasticomyces elasticus]|nr:hypothetical protein LTR15_008665 [Elasticomyces elasticus]
MVAEEDVAVLKSVLVEGATESVMLADAVGGTSDEVTLALVGRISDEVVEDSAGVDDVVVSKLEESLDGEVQVCEASEAVTLQATPQSVTVVDSVQLSLLEVLEVLLESSELDGPSLEAALEAVSVGLFVVCELGGGPSFTGGELQPNPKQGKWKEGSSGRVGQLNSTFGSSGMFQTMTGAQSKQGRMIGTTVVDESELVVVSHSLPVIETELGGSVVIVVVGVSEDDGDGDAESGTEVGVGSAMAVVCPGAMVVVVPSMMMLLDASEMVWDASVNAEPPATIVLLSIATAEAFRPMMMRDPMSRADVDEVVVVSTGRSEEDEVEESTAGELELVVVVGLAAGSEELGVEDNSDVPSPLLETSDEAPVVSAAVVFCPTIGTKDELLELEISVRIVVGAIEEELDGKTVVALAELMPERAPEPV